MSSGSSLEMAAYDEDPYLPGAYNTGASAAAGWSPVDLASYSMAMGLGRGSMDLSSGSQMYTPARVAHSSSGSHDGAHSIAGSGVTPPGGGKKHIPIRNGPTRRSRPRPAQYAAAPMATSAATTTTTPAAAAVGFPPLTASPATPVAAPEPSETTQTLRAVQSLLKTMVDDRREKALSKVLASHREASLAGMSQLASGMKAQVDSVVSGAASSSSDTADVLKTIRTQLWIVGSMIVLIMVLLTIFVALRTQRMR